MYIEGNYLAGSLPGIDGEKMILSNFTIERIISLVILITIVSTLIYVYKKYKFEMIDKVSKYSSLLIIAMLFVSMISFPFSISRFIHNISLWQVLVYI